MYKYINTEHKFIIFWSPKCACTSIQTLVAEYVSGDSNFYKIISKIDDRIPDFQENYLIIVVSRDPFNRLVSGFLNKYVLLEEGSKNNLVSSIKNFKDFVFNHHKIRKEYIYNAHISPQFKGSATELIDKIGRIDHLFLVDRKGDLDGFNKVIAKRTGKDLLPMPWIKKTKKTNKIQDKYYLTRIENIKEPIPNYQSFKSPEIVERIEKDFQIDYQWLEKLEKWNQIDKKNLINK